jgi:hypothetical protein
MKESGKELLRLILRIEWEKTKADYRAAGAPFGPDGLEIWAEYGQLTTVN